MYTTGYRLIARSGPFSLFATDKPDLSAGNASHEYAAITDDEAVCEEIAFQHGPILERGPNGWPDVLLAHVLRDRLLGFQSGPFASKYNAAALKAIEEFIAANDARTALREVQGVEGTNVQHNETT